MLEYSTLKAGLPNHLMPYVELDQLQADDETEKLALAAVEAITRLVAERHTLRAELATKERELTRLRERFVLVRDSYRKLANELVAQLQLFERLEKEEARASGGAELHWLRTEPRD
jgi:hypothetical protein